MNICVSFSIPKYVSLPVQANTSWHIPFYFSSKFWIRKNIFHSKTFLSPSPATPNKAEKICHTMKSKIKGRGGKRERRKLAKGSSTDQLPNHNSKTMSNKKLSKSNFHCHPHFSRSHLPSLWCIWRAHCVLHSGQRQQKGFTEQKQQTHRRSGGIGDFILENGPVINERDRLEPAAGARPVGRVGSHQPGESVCCHHHGEAGRCCKLVL